MIHATKVVYPLFARSCLVDNIDVISSPSPGLYDCPKKDSPCTACMLHIVEELLDVHVQARPMETIDVMYKMEAYKMYKMHMHMYRQHSCEQLLLDLWQQLVLYILHTYIFSLMYKN